MKILAISSGKGGVGKTTVALNIARQLSLAGLRTLIIDFDIHNKGTTCLFMDKVSRSEAKSVLGIMAKCAALAEDSCHRLAESLAVIDLGYGGKLFLTPAARPDEMVKWETFVCDPQTIVRFFRTLITAVVEKFEFDVAIIDCYGGVDTLTISAAGIADDFIIINEPDVITFAGTLLLYKQLESTYRSSARPPKVHFVINRITGRHSFRFLRQEYQVHLSPLAVDRSILAYLPFDKLVFDTFGDYPFFSELLPDGLYAKKIRELIARLWPEPRFTRLTVASDRKRERIYEATAENAFADPERIFKVWKTAPGLALPPLTVLILLYEAPGIESISFFGLRATFYMCLVFVLAVLLVGVLFEPFQITRWLLRKAKYDWHKIKLLRSISVKDRAKALSDYALSCLPAILGILCFCAVLYMAKGQELLYPFRNVSIWRKQIAGFYPRWNYQRLILASHASIQPGLNLSDSQFNDASLEETLFPRVILNHSILQGADLENAVLVGDELNQADLSGESDMNSADVSTSVAGGANFSERSLILAKFWAADLSGANFQKAVLYMTDFRQSNLKGANFSGAIIKDTQFDGADLDGADFSDADFSYIDDERRAELYSQLYHQGAKLCHPDEPKCDHIVAAENWDSGPPPTSNPYWLHWEDKSNPAHLFDVVEPRIQALLQVLRFGITEKKDSLHRNEAKISDEDMLHLLTSPTDFSTRADLIELLLVRAQNEDLQTAKKALEFISHEKQADREIGVTLVLKVLLSIITQDANENKDLDAWKSWLEQAPEGRLVGWSWNMWDGNFPARRYSRNQNSEIRAIHLSAIQDLTPREMMWWFTHASGSPK